MKESKKLKIPPQYLPVIPYLILNDAKGFLEFTKSVFDSKEQLISLADDGKFIHAEIRIFDAVIMFADTGDGWMEKSAAFYIFVENLTRVYELALANSAKSLEAPTRKEHGFTANIEDPFGNFWFMVEAEG